MPANRELRQQVESRAQGQCEYCKMSQVLQGATFHLEHIVPLSRGGSDDLDNLALACPSCNLHKADRTHFQESHTETLVELFHPRRHSWNDHFAWDEYAMVGVTPIGRATISALDLNHVRRLQIRQAEERLGLRERNSK